MQHLHAEFIRRIFRQPYFDRHDCYNDSKHCIGKQYHPLPWQTLKYDTRQEGYVVGLTKEALEGGPAFGTDDRPAWGNRAYEQSIHDYYKTQPYWASAL